MLKFFRKIRKRLFEENKFGKYLLYASGEILLVVIGILIALQVDNWNTQRIEKEVEKRYLTRLKAELESNIERANYVLMGVHHNYEMMLSTTENIDGYILRGLDTANLIYLLNYSWINSLAFSSSAFEEGKQNAYLTKMENQDLLTNIYRHYARQFDMKNMNEAWRDGFENYELKTSASIGSFQRELSILLYQNGIDYKSINTYRISGDLDDRTYWDQLRITMGNEKANEFIERHNWLFDRSSQYYKELESYTVYHINKYSYLISYSNEIIENCKNLIEQIDDELNAE